MSIDHRAIRIDALDATLAEPAVAAFLDAVDRAMNSNTLLLPFELPAAATGAPIAAVVGALLASAAFGEALYAIDRARAWDNHHQIDAVDGEWVRTPRRGTWWTGTAPAMRSLTADAVRARLRWTLTDAPSPHRSRPPADRVGPLVDRFAGYFLARHAEYVDLAPTFLACTGYFAIDPDPEPPPLACFDGGRSDTATLVRCGRRVRLLLTNGSP